MNNAAAKLASQAAEKRAQADAAWQAGDRNGAESLKVSATILERAAEFMMRVHSSGRSLAGVRGSVGMERAVGDKTNE